MKNPSMAKLVKQAGGGKQARISKRITRLEDKAEAFNRQGKDKKAQRKIDKISKLEDKMMNVKRPEPTYEGTDEFRSKRQIRRESAMKLKEDKGPGQGTEVGQFTGAGIPENLFDADGKKISTDKIDEGNLSAIKVEKGTNRKYVVIQEKSVIGDAGGRLYLSNPK